jgi:hypothetical protein
VERKKSAKETSGKRNAGGTKRMSDRDIGINTFKRDLSPDANDKSFR